MRRLACTVGKTRVQVDKRNDGGESKGKSERGNRGASFLPANSFSWSIKTPTKVDTVRNCRKLRGQSPPIETFGCTMQLLSVDIFVTRWGWARGRLSRHLQLGRITADQCSGSSNPSGTSIYPFLQVLSQYLSIFRWAVEILDVSVPEAGFFRVSATKQSQQVPYVLSY
jgi:hypothetical protein